VAHADPENIEAVPEELQGILHAAGWYVPDEGYGGDEIAMVFNRRAKGLCLLCTHRLEENTLIIVSGNGVELGFCGPACMQDFHVMTWLMQVYDELADAAKFRSGEVAPDAPGEQTEEERQAIDELLEDTEQEGGAEGEGEEGEGN
jgi:hypothetical protein